MTDIIATDLQQLEADSSYVELFELVLDSSTILYFHPGVEEDSTSVQFRDRESPFTVRTYEPMPILMDGLELKADGVSSRPTLTIANILNKFSSISGDYSNKNLIGKTLIRRRTLKKHLEGQNEAGGSGTAPTEFPVIKYIVDRIAQETAALVTFEVAVPYDLENIQLPRRVVVGKYCSWEYQGASFGRGGCTFNSSSTVEKLDELDTTNDSTLRAHVAFFNLQNEPLVLNTRLSSVSTTWATSQSYTQETYVSHSGKFWQSQQVHTSATENQPSEANSAYWKEAHPYTLHDNTDEEYAVGDRVQYNLGPTQLHVWRCTKAHNSSTSVVGTIVPSYNSSYWVREDLCNKTLQGCKCRFQFLPIDRTTNNSPPSSRKDTKGILPFGGFPGTLKF